jgi:hypothetical protein
MRARVITFAWCMRMRPVSLLRCKQFLSCAAHQLAFLIKWFAPELCAAKKLQCPTAVIVAIAMLVLAASWKRPGWQMCCYLGSVVVIDIR